MAKKTGLIDYKFRLVSEDTFNAELFVSASTEFVKRQFDKALALTLKKAKMQGGEGADLEKVGVKYEVNSHFYNLAKLQARSFMKDITYQVAKDGIKVVDYKISRAYFYKKDVDEWVLLLQMEGLYIDQR